jgi:hypothetical protein
MKLFVWEEVLSDYTDGIAVALAPDLESALVAVNKAMGYEVELPVSKLKIIDLDGEVQPQGWAVHGGG